MNEYVITVYTHVSYITYICYTHSVYRALLTALLRGSNGAMRITINHFIPLTLTYMLSYHTVYIQFRTKLESSQFSAKLIKPEKMAKKPVFVQFCPRLYIHHVCAIYTYMHHLVMCFIHLHTNTYLYI